MLLLSVSNSRHLGSIAHTVGAQQVSAGWSRSSNGFAYSRHCGRKRLFHNPRREPWPLHEPLACRWKFPANLNTQAVGTCDFWLGNTFRHQKKPPTPALPAPCQLRFLREPCLLKWLKAKPNLIPKVNHLRLCIQVDHGSRRVCVSRSTTASKRVTATDEMARVWWSSTNCKSETRTLDSTVIRAVTIHLALGTCWTLT